MIVMVCRERERERRLLSSSVKICSCNNGCKFRRVAYFRNGKQLKRPLPLCVWGGSCSLMVVENIRSAFRVFGLDRECLVRF